jgi:hypothetical protein
MTGKLARMELHQFREVEQQVDGKIKHQIIVNGWRQAVQDSDPLSKRLESVFLHVIGQLSDGRMATVVVTGIHCDCLWTVWRHFRARSACRSTIVAIGNLIPILSVQD